MIHARYEPLIKRIPTVINRMDGIQSYDTDNLYPQRVEEINNRSYTLKSATQKLSEFISGLGFSDPFLANTVLDSEEGTTANNLLRSIAKDYSKFCGFAIHVKYNMNFKHHCISHVPFKYCRLGIPEQDTWKVTDIKVSDNWERDMMKTEKTQVEIESFPVYNPKNLENELEVYGWDNHPGQILYYTEENGIYPFASFDPVLDNAQTQGEIGVYELSNIQEGFVATTVFKYPGTFKDKAEEDKIKAKIEEHKGAGGSRIFVAENANDQASNLFESLSLPNVDKMFELTAKSTKNAIRENYSMPAEILGVMPETGMFNQEQMEQAFKYFNNVTKAKRVEVSEVFRKILMKWKTDLPDNYEISPLTYE